MAITMQILEQRLTALERELANLKAELAVAHTPAAQQSLIAGQAEAQHAAVVASWQTVRQRLDIRGQPIGAKQLRQRLIASGMNPADNSLSRELIALREE